MYKVISVINYKVMKSFSCTIWKKERVIKKQNGSSHVNDKSKFWVTKNIGSLKVLNSKYNENAADFDPSWENSKRERSLSESISNKSDKYS